MWHVVRRWGVRAVGLVVTGIGLYVVAPSVVALVGEWPQLRDVRPLWFGVLAVLVVGSWACLWVLVRTLLPGTPWTTVGSAQLAGLASGCVLPGGSATGTRRAGLDAGEGRPPPGEGRGGPGQRRADDDGHAAGAADPDRPGGRSSDHHPRDSSSSGSWSRWWWRSSSCCSASRCCTGTRSSPSSGEWPATPYTWSGARSRSAAVAERVVAQRDAVAAAFAGHWGRALAAAAGNRMLDYSALVAAVYAVGGRARPSMVLLAYVLSLALALVPVTPGGLGFVEAGLTSILVLAGVSSDQAVLGTLLYRLFSFWLPIPLGVLAWTGWRFTAGQRSDA